MAAPLDVPPLRKVAITGTVVCPHCKGELFKVLLDLSDLAGKVRGGDTIGPGDVPAARVLGVVCNACGEEYPYVRAGE